MPPKSWINLTHNGDPDFVFPGRDTKINGYPCRGGGGAEGPSTALYPSGKFKTCWLAADVVVDGIPCMHASFLSDVFTGAADTDFHENDKLKGCKLSRDTTLEGRVFNRGDRVRLDVSGKLTGSDKR